MAGWTKQERQWRIQAIMRRDGKRCWLCGERLNKRNDRTTIDHAIPKGRGGTNHLHNLRLAHESCNNARGMIAETPPRAARARLKGLTISMSVLELTADMIVGSAELQAAA